MSGNQRNRFHPPFIIPTHHVRLPNHLGQRMPMMRAPIMPRQFFTPPHVIPMRFDHTSNILGRPIVRFPPPSSAVRFPARPPIVSATQPSGFPRLLGPAIMSVNQSQSVVVKRSLVVEESRSMVVKRSQVVGSPIIHHGVSPHCSFPSLLPMPLLRSPLLPRMPLLRNPSQIRPVNPFVGNPIIRHATPFHQVLPCRPLYVQKPPVLCLALPPKAEVETSDHIRSRSPDRRSPDRRSSDRRSPVRRSPDRMSLDRMSPDRMSPDRMSPDRRNPDRRSPDCRSPDRMSPDRRNSDRRSPDRRSTDRRSPDRSGSGDGKYSTRLPEKYDPRRSTPPKRSRYAGDARDPDRGSSSSSWKHSRAREDDRSSPPPRKRHCVDYARRDRDRFGRRVLAVHHRSHGPRPSEGSLRMDLAESRVSHSPSVGETMADPAASGSPEWLRCSPADLHFRRDDSTGCTWATERMRKLEEMTQYELCDRASRARLARPPVFQEVGEGSEMEDEEEIYHHHHRHHHHDDGSSSSSSDSGSDDEEEEESDDENEEDNENEEVLEEALQKWREEMKEKKKHPDRLHDELWYNDDGETNDGKLCRCSLNARKTGIRHEIYPGEAPVPLCDAESNCKDKLYHYRITISPDTNFETSTPTVIEHDNHIYTFEGFSIFSHYELPKLPPCKVVRFYIEYTVHFTKERFPENFTINSLNLFTDFMFREILELVDINWRGPGVDEGCYRYHLMPRFTRPLPDNGKELLSINEVLKYLLYSSRPVLTSEELSEVHGYHQDDWQQVAQQVRGMIVTAPAMKPSSLRVDQLDRQQDEWEKGDNSVDTTHPLIIHFGLRPAQASYAGEPKYQKKFKRFMKYKHILACKPKITSAERHKLGVMDECLKSIKEKSALKREVTVEVSSDGFLRTGLNSDLCQHALLMPLIISHLRFHNCLSFLEDFIGYTFADRSLLQLAVTHDSHPINYGTNPDHARNSLSNCGIRRPEYGDRKVHYVYTRKKGINVLMAIMARLGEQDEQASKIPHNERLEYLGDSVIEFLSSIHLFFMFPWLEEGGLTTYRSALVQNQNLAILAKNIHLQEYMLYAHGPDLCYERYLKHAMANCFEALMGALYLDGGIDVVDRVFSRCLFAEPELHEVWTKMVKHPLQMAEVDGDRHWLKTSPILKKLLKFEDSIGVEFTHIRLLARAFTFRNVGYNNLTLGHNQRLEFLGDTVLQFVASDYLYKHFPNHHEGHLTILRSSLVNKKTQSIVCDDLGMTDFMITSNGSDKVNMKVKEKADLLEAFMGALYVDKGLESCERFCSVCFFPRLKDFIMYQDWNDAKSNLQQICLTLRELDGKEPELPTYKVLACIGPTNSRRYTVAVYFKKKRLATGYGSSIQLAQMDAARTALCSNTELFPILLHQKRFLTRTKHRHLDRLRRYAMLTKTSVADSPL